MNNLSFRGAEKCTMLVMLGTQDKKFSFGFCLLYVNGFGYVANGCENIDSIAAVKTKLIVLDARKLWQKVLKRSVLSKQCQQVRRRLRLPLSVVGDPFPVKKIDIFQRRRTITENQYHTQTIGHIVNIHRRLFCPYNLGSSWSFDKADLYYLNVKRK